MRHKHIDTVDTWNTEFSAIYTSEWEKTTRRATQFVVPGKANSNLELQEGGLCLAKWGGVRLSSRALSG